ncbi:tRNA (adenine(22)-N(1))-methyltransferase TrmK [Alteribacillus sp. HJP-4]|uniref:tRNA (adenine(22)-N(1))-methyltransferase n=1 Tax=Alteribacillus sp. HJP-4 TaxID=2775394 RepID=UPI0035CCE2AD
MNVDQLSDRLTAIAEEVPRDTILADVGTDHGYLPIFLIRNKKIKSALATDINSGPLRSAERKIKEHHLNEVIQTRTGSGLAPLKDQDQIDTIVIAGMGGTLITSILEEGKQKLERVSRLILQPNVAADNVRRWMIKNNWQLINEELLEEDGHFYEILTAVPGDGEAPYDDISIEREASILFGPILIQKQNSAFKLKWEREKKKWEHVLQQMKQANDKNSAEIESKKWAKRCKWLEEVYKYETS